MSKIVQFIQKQEMPRRGGLSFPLFSSLMITKALNLGSLRIYSNIYFKYTCNNEGTFRKDSQVQTLIEIFLSWKDVELQRENCLHNLSVMNLNSRVKLGGSVMDSGLVVVVFIITSLIITVFSFLLFVDYEWCHVLFKNNTVIKSKYSSLNFGNFKLQLVHLLFSRAQVEDN